MDKYLLIAQILIVGLGATALMDVWLLAIQRLGVPTQSFAMVGRWLGHVRKGTWFHPAISKSAPVRGELVMGWIAHYTTGLLFALSLVLIEGADWLKEPTPLPALVFGVVTVLVPWLIVQPAMGAGLASSKTPSPLQSRIRNVLNHAIFGLGLYVSAWLSQICLSTIN